MVIDHIFYTKFLIHISSLLSLKKEVKSLNNNSLII